MLLLSNNTSVSFSIHTIGGGRVVPLVLSYQCFSVNIYTYSGTSLIITDILGMEILVIDLCCNIEVFIFQRLKMH